MKLLLDTHIWLWWVNRTEELSKPHQHLIEQAQEVYVSSVSCWELLMLHQRNRIQLPTPSEDWFRGALNNAGIICLPITQEIAIKSALLPFHHRDPADRFIMATALEHGCTLMSFDQQFERYEELSHLLIGRRLD